MQIFEDLFAKLKKHEISNFSSWLHSVARNHCLMKLRKKTPDNYHAEINENILENYVESEVELHLNNENNKTDEEKLKDALLKLNNDQRICVELFFLQEKSYNEVAQITGYSLKQVKSFLQNGKRNLKKLLS
jgi:RNA polymerase sigma-70 factor (ECF subfamily)